MSRQRVPVPVYRLLIYN